MNRRLNPFQHLLPLTLLLLLTGCASNQKQLPGMASASHSSSLSPAQVEVESGEATCKAIARDLSANNRHSFLQKVDSSYILARILEALKNDTPSRQKIQNYENRLNEQIPGMLFLNSEGANWEMLRGREDGSNYRCLVRSGLSEEGVRYVEFELGQVDGRFRVFDWNDLIRNARVSDLFAELFSDINEMANAHKTALPFMKSSVVEEQKLYLDFLLNMRSLDPKRALASYDSLPLRFKIKPLYTLMAINVASKLDEDQYQRFMRGLARRYNDDRYGMLLLDLYVMDHQYDKASEVLHNFKQQIGRDPLLELLLANLEFERGDKEAFFAYCLKAVEADAAYLDTYWLLLDQFVVDGNYEDAVLVLNVLSNMFEITLDEDVFKSDAKYRDFIRSTAFKSWLAKVTL